MKRCNKCGIDKPTSDFGTILRQSGNRTLSAWCKPCCAERTRHHRRKREQENRCLACGGPRDEETAHCSTCKAKNANQQKQWIVEGRCRNCGGIKLPKVQICEPCWWKNLSIKVDGSVQAVDALKSLFVNQQGRCALTGVPLEVGDNASIDHVQHRSNGGGNEPNNLRFTTIAVNVARQTMPDADFIAMCRSVLEHAGFEVTKKI